MNSLWEVQLLFPSFGIKEKLVFSLVRKLKSNGYFSSFKSFRISHNYKVNDIIWKSISYVFKNNEKKNAVISIEICLYVLPWE